MDLLIYERKRKERNPMAGKKNDNKLRGKRDEEGFIQLIPKSENKTEKVKSVKKSDGNPFKMGSYKYRLFKSLQKHRTPKWVLGFHHEKAENVILGVDKKDKPKTIITSYPVGKKELNDAGIQKSEGLSVLINCGMGTYQKIPYSVYKKFKKIEKMIITVRLETWSDGDDEGEEVYAHQYFIDSIGELMRFYLYLRHLDEYVNELTSSLLWYNRIKFKIDTMVDKGKDKPEYFKGNFNEFLEKYGFKELI